jgi:hypothetical protein
MKLLRKINLFPLLFLCACQSYFETDKDLGSSVNAAIANQTVNPNAASLAPELVRGLDGVSAKNSIDSYQNSFIRKIPGGDASTNSGITNSGASNSGGISMGNPQP